MKYQIVYSYPGKLGVVRLRGSKSNPYNPTNRYPHAHTLRKSFPFSSFMKSIIKAGHRKKLKKNAKIATTNPPAMNPMMVKGMLTQMPLVTLTPNLILWIYNSIFILSSTLSEGCFPFSSKNIFSDFLEMRDS